MSSGGQNTATLNGLQGMRLRDASDVLTQTKLRLAYITNTPSNSRYVGMNAYRSEGIQNSYSFLFQVQQGLRECAAVQGNAINFLPPGGAGLSNSTIPVPLYLPA
jgi:hypothetical protein